MQRYAVLLLCHCRLLLLFTCWSSVGRLTNAFTLCPPSISKSSIHPSLSKSTLFAIIERRETDTDFATDDNDYHHHHNHSNNINGDNFQRYYYSNVRPVVVVPVPTAISNVHNGNNIIYGDDGDDNHEHYYGNDNKYVEQQGGEEYYEEYEEYSGSGVDMDNNNNNMMTEEAKRRRAIAAMLQNMNDPSSYSPTTNTHHIRTNKAVSESMKRREQRETSVGQRRIGSASRARSGSGNGNGSSSIGILMGNIRTSAAAAAASALKKKQMGQSSSSSPFIHKDDQSDNGTSSVNSRLYSNSVTHWEVPTMPKFGSIIIPQRLHVYQSSLIPRSQLTDYVSVQVAKDDSNIAIAKLRLSVFGSHSVRSSKEQLINHSCQMIEKRRQMGSICLTASVNYVDACSCLVGSLECSTHEVSIFFF